MNAEIYILDKFSSFNKPQQLDTEKLQSTLCSMAFFLLFF